MPEELGGGSFNVRWPTRKTRTLGGGILVVKEIRFQKGETDSLIDRHTFWGALPLSRNKIPKKI